MRGDKVLNLTLIVLTLLASVLLAALILTLGLWMRGIDSIVFPGLGLIIATPIIALALLMAEAILVKLTAYLIRYVPLETLFSWISSIS
jgi:hypothetical protein